MDPIAFVTGLAQSRDIDSEIDAATGQVVALAPVLGSLRSSVTLEMPDGSLHELPLSSEAFEHLCTVIQEAANGGDPVFRYEKTSVLAAIRGVIEETNHRCNERAVSPTELEHARSVAFSRIEALLSSP
jgi:hypothetical protein